LETVFIIAAIVLAGLGVIGAVLPGLPGPLLSWSGYLVLYFSPDSDISWQSLLVSLFLALLITAVDVYVPIFGAKKFGSTKQGIYGGMIGLVIGIFFFPPIGVILGPFLGTIAGDLIAGNNIRMAVKSGAGALLGFLAGTLIKLLYSVVIVVLIFVEAGHYIAGLF